MFGLSSHNLLLRGSDIDFYVEDSKQRERLVFSCKEVTLSTSQLLHIVGSNGAGKTSLLRILSGLQDCSGRVEIFCDRDDILYIGHGDGLSDVLTVWEHLCLWQDLGGGIVDDLESFAHGWVSQSLWHNRVGDCSAGECRKLSLLRLLLSSAVIWFLDEPFASLDIGVRDKFLREFRIHCSSGGGIIMTGHGDNFGDFDLDVRLFQMGKG